MEMIDELLQTRGGCQSVDRLFSPRVRPHRTRPPICSTACGRLLRHTPLKQLAQAATDARLTVTLYDKSHRAIEKAGEIRSGVTPSMTAT
jgi:hypothetical protein